jgi:hypothetical protein
MKMNNRTNRERGRKGLALAIAYFGTLNNTVNIPLNDTQWYDLVIETSNGFKTVQCKCTDTENNTISLRSTGGTDGKEYDNILNHPLDYLFCIDKSSNMFLIPVNDIRRHNIKTTISLRLSKNANHQGLNTYKYYVGNFLNSKNCMTEEINESD